MTPEPLLHRLREELTPDQAQRDRVRMQMQARIGELDMMVQAKQESEPTTQEKNRIWESIAGNIDHHAVSSAFDRLRAFFEPSAGQHQRVRARLLDRLMPIPERASYRSIKWVAAFALILIVLRASPVLFLAPPTVAESAVILVPTRGDVSIDLHNLWQPVSSEITLKEGVKLQTRDGEASVILHDDGTVRMADNTTLSLHDLTDRPEPAFDGPTMTLNTGHVWLQGLLPQHLRGVTVATPYGDITVNAGSVSIELNDSSVIVRTWDRHAAIMHNGTETTLVAGERARFGSDAQMSITRIGEDEYDESWVVQNLQRDAVHQREIAQMQQERRAAQAGILPTSPLYTVKRVAERVDVLFTLDPEERVQKRLDQASTRLDEAAALIAEGDNGANASLQEYKQAMIAVASGSGGGSVTQFLVRQEIAENSAELSAALPDDELYPLKKAVLEASAQLPLDVVDAADVEGMLLVDNIDVLQEAIAMGDTARAEETYNALKPYLSSLEEDGTLKPGLKKEALSLLSEAAALLREKTGTGITTTLAGQLEPYLPKPEAPVITHLSDEQIDALVAQIYERIFVFSQQRSRWNQLMHEIRQLKGHQDEGRILRRLYHALPQDGIARYVRTAIQELREEVAE